jgi:hypothetical protein
VEFAGTMLYQVCKRPCVYPNRSVDKHRFMYKRVPFIEGGGGGMDYSKIDRQSGCYSSSGTYGSIYLKKKIQKDLNMDRQPVCDS